jgi:hypothetical protein
MGTSCLGKRLWRSVLLLPALSALLWAGCVTTAMRGRTTAMTAAQAGGPDPAPAEARVWAENCGRCHNLRSPREFDYDQWEVIVHHMRIRATLTEDECRAVLKFLKAAQ